MAVAGSVAWTDGGGGAPRLVFLSTYPPTRCGLATFTHSLVNGVLKHRRRLSGVGVVRVLRAEDPVGDRDPLILARIPPALLGQAVGDLTADFDVLVLQHEYGIFGPEDGTAVLDLLEAINMPVLATLHTVPAAPTLRQQMILERLVERAETAVLMTEAARERLTGNYRVDPSKLVVIPHGAHGFTAATPSHRQRPHILTWGLLGPGKGVEWGILAMRQLRHMDPLPHYLIQGATHPRVVSREGERYRGHLCDLVADEGLSGMVRIEGGYLTHDDLGRLVAATDVVLLPYDSREQVTSGVLVEALTAGKPVVATAFPHAVEVLSTGAGRLVPHQDPDAMAGALRALLTDPYALAAARAAARRMAPELLWSAVAARYCEEAARLLAGTRIGR